MELAHSAEGSYKSGDLSTTTTLFQADGMGVSLLQFCLLPSIALEYYFIFSNSRRQCARARLSKGRLSPMADGRTGGSPDLILRHLPLQASSTWEILEPPPHGVKYPSAIPGP